MWKTNAKFISELIYQENGYAKYWKADLENKDGVFNCSFGIKLLENHLKLDKKVCFLKCQKNIYGYSCKEIQFLDDKEELTHWERTAINSQEPIKRGDLEEKLKEIIELLEKETNKKWFYRLDSDFFIQIECFNAPYLRFAVVELPKNKFKLDNNPALNHLKNIYTELSKLEVHFLFKDIKERIKILELWEKKKIASVSILN